ncbi:tryptophan halogenase [Novosphingobium nitrogenifigens DSM 19370]|uniref:Tryptophan halogenase n=1 Tax=Novosphingobium nitrogenifigens DSM 19370 TaxID=983920 RepID=F1ZAZ4_9SPHN|nr:tryptophan halogenase family protein [Novosphingobium nitrogenifigens]EGD58228.1 tryptophan halogenase [Novosphingobium nitrogenifigens DSM 19370]
MTDAPPTRIAIVGGGTAGWIAASALTRFLPKGRFSIALVESEEIGIVGVGEATIPQIRLLNAALGIDEYAFMRASQATYKLGIEFVGWGTAASRYIHAFGSVGRPTGTVPFHHYWLRGRQLGQRQPLDAYSLNAQAAWSNRFAKTDGIDLPYAFHFDAALYARFLRGWAEARGVTRHEGRIVEVRRDGESGEVRDVVLSDGRAIAADLFLDCSGFRGILIEQALETGYEDWTHWLPCDRAIAIPCAPAPSLAPYTRSTAHRAGWQWRIPLQHRIGNGHVYCSAHTSDEEALAVLLANLDGEPLGEPRTLRFSTGRRKAFWNRNVVALGLAAGFMEPLESTSIHLVQSAIERVIRYLPNGPIRAADVAAYNAETVFEWERVRDFIILHYHANSRPEPFWRTCATMAVPETLAAKLALFRANGRITRQNEELFAEVGWLQVLIGQGIMPEGWHPLADGHSPAEVVELLTLLRQVTAKQASTLSDHAQFLARHCPAPSPTRQAAPSVMPS